VSIAFCSAATTAQAVGQEVGALAEHLLRYPGGIRAERWPLPAATCSHPETGTDHAPVLLLHGLFDNRAVFTRMRRSLAAHGWEHVHALNHSLLTVDVRSAAALLGRHVAHTREVYGGEQVALVGHSLGGLIARYYVQLLGGDQDVHTVVTLGTPHQGTVGAQLLRPLPIARQLLPSSSVLEELRAPAPGCRTRFVVFRGDHDALVLPNRRAELRHPDLWTENILVPGVGHVALPVHPTVIAQVRAALAADRPASSGTAVRLTA
jgi:pimeloyl-ACP methyl ester carboxylesterase